MVMVMVWLWWFHYYFIIDRRKKNPPWQFPSIVFKWTSLFCLPKEQNRATSSSFASFKLFFSIFFLLFSTKVYSGCGSICIVHFSLIHLLKETSFGIEFLDCFFFVFFWKKIILWNNAYNNFSSLHWTSAVDDDVVFQLNFLALFSSIASPHRCFIWFFFLLLQRIETYVSAITHLLVNIINTKIQVNKSKLCLLSIDCSLPTNSIEAEEYGFIFSFSFCLSINKFSTILHCGFGSVFEIIFINKKCILGCVASLIPPNSVVAEQEARDM